MRQMAMAAALMAAQTAAAADDDWRTYRDWQVQRSVVDTGEDIRATCVAWTGGDGQPMLAVRFSNGDAPPPDAWPSVAYEESAPRGYATALRGGESVTFRFDTGVSVPGGSDEGYTDDGILMAFGRPDAAYAQDMLRLMRTAGEVRVFRRGDELMRASLSGFTAAYGAMAEMCGFSTVGVID